MFFLQQPNLNQFVNETFAYLCRFNSHKYLEHFFIKAKRKKLLKFARMSKKLKGIDDSIYAEISCITALRDQQMINNNKINPDLKA